MKVGIILKEEENHQNHLLSSSLNTHKNRGKYKTWTKLARNRVEKRVFCFFFSVE